MIHSPWYIQNYTVTKLWIDLSYPPSELYIYFPSKRKTGMDSWAVETKAHIQCMSVYLYTHTRALSWDTPWRGKGEVEEWRPQTSCLGPGRFLLCESIMKQGMPPVERLPVGGLQLRPSFSASRGALMMSNTPKYMYLRACYALHQYAFWFSWADPSIVS